MLQRFERFLDLRAGELERGLLLFAYLFLVIASFVVGKSIRDALFIDEFGALLLPYADIGVAMLVGLWVSVYLRLARRLSLRQLLVASLLFFAVNCLMFWVIAHNSRPRLADARYLRLGGHVRRRGAGPGLDAGHDGADYT